MTLPLWPQYFVDNDVAGRVTDAFMDMVRLAINRAVDGGEGGEYTPSNPIDVGGAGMRVNSVGAASMFGTVTRSALFMNSGRVRRFTLTSFDVSAMVPIVDIISLDGSGMTGVLNLTLRVQPEFNTGMVVWVVADPLNTFNVDINSDGSNLNPIFTLNTGGVLPPWAAFWFDASLVDGNASGTWRPMMHGDV